jgi:hypothetical protein
MDVLLGTFGCLRRAACAAALYEQLLRHDARCDAVPSALPGVMALAGATELLMPRHETVTHRAGTAADLRCRLGLLDVLPCCVTRLWFDDRDSALQRSTTTWVRGARLRSEFPHDVAGGFACAERLLSGDAAGGDQIALSRLYAEFGAQLKHVGGVMLTNEDLPALACGLTRPATFRTLDFAAASAGVSARSSCVLPFLAACPRTTALNLARSEVGSGAVGAIANLLGARLRHLVLREADVGEHAGSDSEDDELGGYGYSAMDALAAHCGPTLRSLDVSATYLSQAELMIVATRFPNMRSLVIAEMEETDDLDANAVTAAVFRHAHLDWQIEGAPTTAPYTAAEAAGFVAPPTLTALSLSAVTLPAWPPGLVSVDLSGNPGAARDDGLVALAARCGATLRDVNLSRTGFAVTFAGIRALCDQCPRLRSLWARAATLDKHLSVAECRCIAGCAAAANGSLELLDVPVACPRGAAVLLGGCAGLQVLVAGFSRVGHSRLELLWAEELYRASDEGTAIAVASPALRAASLIHSDLMHSEFATGARVVHAIAHGAAAAGARQAPLVQFRYR